MRPPCSRTNFSDCTNIPPEPQAGIIDAAFVGGEHFNNGADDGTGGVKLAAVLALCAGKAGEEIFVNATEQINGTVRFCILALCGGGDKSDGADEIDQFAEAVFVERGARIVFRQHAFEARVVAFKGDHRVIHDLADGGLLGRSHEV